MIGPTLHLGGTSYKELAEKYDKAIAAVGFAKDALTEACPHPRDYIRRDDGYRVDLKRHLDRLGSLNEIMFQLEAIREMIQEQQDQRERQKAR